MWIFAENNYLYPNNINMELLTNEVVISIISLLVMSMMRVNVIISLIVSAIICGVLGNYGENGLGLKEAMMITIKTFTGGLGGGAETAMNYAMLGAFATALSRSGLTEWLAMRVIEFFGKKSTPQSILVFKYIFIFSIVALSVSSQNLIPIHIAFIPIIIPPLLQVMNQLNIDRRAIACGITFGLTATYMIVPLGFGQIFIESILVKNINLAGEQFGLVATTEQMTKAMLIPVGGMILGLLFAFFVSYRKPRIYKNEINFQNEGEYNLGKIKYSYIIMGIVAIGITCGVQLMTNSTIVGSLCGLAILALGGVFKLKDSNDIFQKGLQLMAMIGFVMISASGFASVVNSTNGIPHLVENLNTIIGANNKGISAFLMLIVGLFITMGIGSSFSTVPIISSIYVPLCISFGFSPLATMAIVGVSAALGDAGSPASDSTLGPTSGLNADGNHDHIRDSVVPTFLHFNIPLLIFGWIAAMIL